MDDQFDLEQFERGVEKMLQAHQRLKATNRMLLEERELMYKRNMELRHRMETVVSRIKALEKHYSDGEA